MYPGPVQVLVLCLVQAVPPAQAGVSISASAASGGAYGLGGGHAGPGASTRDEQVETLIIRCGSSREWSLH